MIFISQLLQLRNRKNSERGLTLTELLVAMGLLVLVAGVALAILLSTTSASSRFGQNTANQTEVANAINIINRDISAATSIDDGSNSAIELFSNEDSKSYTVKIFGYNPSKADKGLPSGFTVNTGNLPTFPAIIEQRQEFGSSTMTQNVLVPGWVSSNQSTPLFTYYDSKDAQLQPEVNGQIKQGITASAARVEFFISAKVSDRSSNIELAGSATVHSVGNQVTGAGVVGLPPVPIAPVLRGTLAEGERTAHLTWEVTGGSTSYTLYRKVNGSPYEVRAIISDPDTKKFDDSQNIEWGNIYTYYIVAFGSGGASANSNFVSLTVVPDKVTIVNINSKADLTPQVQPNAGASTINPVNGYPYTVARNLTNQITWQPVNGATGYYVFKDGSTTPLPNTPVGNNVNSIQDINTGYGQKHSYTVEAFNEGTNCTGVCDGKLSDPVSLISPPTSPSITSSNGEIRNRDSVPFNSIFINNPGSAYSDVNVQLYRSVAQGAASSCDNMDAVNDSGLTNNNGSRSNNYVSFGQGACYGVKAYNDAGYSPMSNTSREYQAPSTFGFQNVNSTAGLNDSANGYLYTVARDNTNQLSWNESYGAEGYEIYRSNGDYITYVGADVHSWRENASNGNVRGYFIRAYVDWNDPAGNKRKVTDTSIVTLVSPPTAPQISAVANDDSTASKSTNYVYVNNYGVNTARVTIYRAQQAASNPQCTTNSALTNSADGTNGDGNADWGSSTCYQARAYNDAGASPLSNTATANQLPGKFGFNSWQNTRNYLASYAEGFIGLTNSSNNNNDGSSSRRNQSLSYSLGWGASLGSSRYNLIYGYKNDNNATRNDWSGNGYSVCGGANSGIMNSLMPSSSVDNTQCFLDDDPARKITSYQTSNLSPGSYYRAVAVAVGNNGTRRGSSTEFATSPTIPKFTSVYSYKRQVDNAGPNGSSYMARVANVSLATTFGSATSIRTYFDWNDRPTTEGSGVASPTWYSRSAAQGSNEYLTVRTSGHTGTEASLNRSPNSCRQVAQNYCDVFNTTYDANGDANTGTDLTSKYNSNRFSAYPNNSGPPPRYQWGNADSLQTTGGAQTYLNASRYNYAGYSDLIQWEGGISESNCYYRACNPNDTDVTAGSNSGPWAGYSYNEYVPKGSANHAYYFMSGAQDISPNSDLQGNPPSIATRTYATSSASTSDGSLPANNSASND